MREGASVLEVLRQAGCEKDIMAVLIGGRSCGLDEIPADRDTLIPLSLTHDEGRRVYERTLRFVMMLALRAVFPGQRIRVEYSAGYGVYVRLPGVELTPWQLDMV